MKHQSDEPMEQRIYQTACERCKKRKIKCDRIHSCINCRKTHSECIFPGLGEKQRPIPRKYVQALEGQVAFLDQFITNLISVKPNKRDELLSTFRKTSNHEHINKLMTTCDRNITTSRVDPISVRARVEHIRNIRDGSTAEVFGPTSPTSFFNASCSTARHPSVEAVASSLGTMNNDGVFYGEFDTPLPGDDDFCDLTIHSYNSSIPFSHQSFVNDRQINPPFAPQADICRHLIALFFQTQYQFHMCFYREYFLRDYDIGYGPYYSDLLLYAICAMGALASEDSKVQHLSDSFLLQAQKLLYSSSLESPNLTTLQALILIGHHEIGSGRTSKGWLFSGMAFRLAHEMGLHLDPNNWDGSSSQSRVEREILRRTYWAAFIADKQLSLYFGRPPALYPGESDVKDTERIPYPSQWRNLLNRYVKDGTSATDYEDGDGLVAAFVQKVQLCKILHRMITEVFGSRRNTLDDTLYTAAVKDIHVSLTKWSTDLPRKLHWNKWSAGVVPQLVLELHLLYHTSMIILHRPARQSFDDPNMTTTKDIAICYDSLDSVIKLLRVFSKQYSFRSLPFTFVHTLATAASVILLRQHLDSSKPAYTPPSKSLDIVLEALAAISQVWPCAKQIQKVILSAFENLQKSSQDISPASFDFMEFEPDCHDMTMDAFFLGGDHDFVDFNQIGFLGRLLEVLLVDIYPHWDTLHRGDEEPSTLETTQRLLLNHKAC